MMLRGIMWAAALAALTGCSDATSSTDAAADASARTDVLAPDAAEDATLDAPSAEVGRDAADATPMDAASMDTSPVDASPVDAPDVVTVDVPSAAPFTAPTRTWTWVPVDGMQCDDGSSTGVGVNLVDGAAGTLVVLNGGGACWDAMTCIVLNTSVHGPFGMAQFNALSSTFATTILDRDVAGSPFANWNIVFVPYCTSDAHAGTRAADYTTGAMIRTLRHVGRINLQRVLPRVAATTPAGARVAVVGLSTGGFGAVLQHDLVRAYFPAGALAVVSDSGPLLQGDGVPAATRAAWYARWGLDWLDASCPDCRTDLSRIYTGLAARHPSDRTAILSSRRDAVLAGYFSLAPADFESALRGLATTFSALPNRAFFLVDGAAHTALGRPATVTAADGAPLLPWITQMVTDATAWSSHGL